MKLGTWSSAVVNCVDYAKSISVSMYAPRRPNTDKIQDRIDRAMNQDITLQASFGTSNDVLVRIQGTTGMLYLVHICDEMVECSCEDHRNRFSHCSPVCKHIISVMMNMFDANEVDVLSVVDDVWDNRSIMSQLEGFKAGRHANAEDVRRKAARLIPRYRKKGRVKKRAVVKVVKPRDGDADCFICLEPLDGTPTTFCGATCGKRVHSGSCIETWLRINRTCPMCKSPWVDGAKEKKYAASVAREEKKRQEAKKRAWGKRVAEGEAKEKKTKTKTKTKKTAKPDIFLTTPPLRRSSRKRVRRSGGGGEPDTLA